MYSSVQRILKWIKHWNWHLNCSHCYMGKNSRSWLCYQVATARLWLQRKLHKMPMFIPWILSVIILLFLTLRWNGEIFASWFYHKFHTLLMSAVVSFTFSSRGLIGWMHLLKIGVQSSSNRALKKHHENQQKYMENCCNKWMESMTICAL